MKKPKHPTSERARPLEPVSATLTSSTSARAADTDVHGRIAALEKQNRELQEQARQLQYVKTISDLLTGVAHDLSGALTGIVWCTEAIRDRALNQDPDLAMGLQDLVGAADYARRLARKLMSVGRQREGRFERCHIQKEIAEAVNLLDVLRPRKVRLVSALEAPNCDIWASPEQLQQLLVNLGTNAFDAIGPEGGEVFVGLHLVPATDPARGNQVVLHIRDTGHGMSKDTLRRATEPYFTTKGPIDGNGLGLVVVKSVAERHAAQLQITSEVGKGTTVEVTFSRLEASSP